MSHQLHQERLSRLRDHLGDLFSHVANCGGQTFLTPELGDEIAATAGEIMVELSDHRSDKLVHNVVEGARHLREVVHTIRPEVARAYKVMHALISDLELILRQDSSTA